MMYCTSCKADVAEPCRNLCWWVHTACLPHDTCAWCPTSGFLCMHLPVVRSHSKNIQCEIPVASTRNPLAPSLHLLQLMYIKD